MHSVRVGQLLYLDLIILSQHREVLWLGNALINNATLPPSCRPDDRSVPEECAVKVFKTTLNEFKNRDTYIREDYRFKGRYKKQGSRQLVQLWAEKEKHNLKR